MHLAPAAQTVLEALPKGESGDLIFALPGGKKLSSYSAMKRELAKAIAAASAGAAEIPNWTFHDFRRAGVTALADAGFPPHVCDRLLNHVTGTIQGVAAVYQRAEFLVERKAALEAWAAHVLSCEGEKPEGNVVALHEGRSG